MSEPVFERTADETMARVRTIYADRGANYRDTWDLENQTRAVADATLDRFGIPRLTPEQMRLLQLACLIDVKDSRLIGKWNPDSIDDGIAYRASYCTHRTEYEAAKPFCCAQHSEIPPEAITNGHSNGAASATGEKPRVLAPTTGRCVA